MSHANAPLSELGRLKLARFHIESGSTIRGTAERFQVSTTTVIRWTRRYRAVPSMRITWPTLGFSCVTEERSGALGRENRVNIHSTEEKENEFHLMAISYPPLMMICFRTTISATIR